MDLKIFSLYLNIIKNYLVLPFLTIWLLSLHAYAQSTDDAIRSFETKITKAPVDTTRIDLLLQLGDYCSLQSFAYQEKALRADQQALALSKTLNSKSWENKCLIQLAIQYAILNDFEASRASYQQVTRYWQQRGNLKALDSTYDQLQSKYRYGKNRNLEMLKEALTCLQIERSMALENGNTLKAIMCLKDRADTQLNLGQLNIAETELLQVIRQLKAIHYADLRNTYNLLASVYHLKGNLNKELFYLLEAQKEAETAKDTSILIQAYRKLGWVYEDLGMYDKSLFYYNRLLAGNPGSLYKNNNDCFAYFGRICSVMIKQHKPLQALHFLQAKQLKIKPASDLDKTYLDWDLAICYVALKYNNLAEYYLLRWINTIPQDWGAVGINYNLTLSENKTVCEFYISANNYTEAGFYLKKALSVPQFNVSAVTRSQMQLLQFKVDSASGNFVSAIKHFEMHKRMTDSIFNEKENNDVAAIQAKFETERKDKDILLLKKQSVIDREKFRNRRIVANFLIAGVLLLLLLLGVLYNRYLLRQHSIILLEGKQTEISGKNRELEKLLIENEWLLKEVHHRVKNNLQIVTSLLHSQSRYLKDETALNVVLDSQHRVNAMSLIHQKLYKSPDIKSIYMPEYIGELVDYLKESFKAGLQIIFKVDIAPIMLSAVHAVPVGLILNEIITNSLKYAFPFSSEDAISIKMTQSETGEIELKVSDNGRGMPRNFDVSQNNSFGMILIQGLVEDLNGDFLLESINGTSITIRFNAQKERAIGR